MTTFRCRFFDKNVLVQVKHLHGVPRVGECVIWGYGSEYQCRRVKSVTWDAESVGSEADQQVVNISLEPGHVALGPSSVHP